MGGSPASATSTRPSTAGPGLRPASRSRAGDLQGRGRASSARPRPSSGFLNADPGKIGGMTTVLVVDDEPTIREIVAGYLKRDGYRTLEAADGNRARELLERDPPDLVVLDVMLPGADGPSSVAGSVRAPGCR